MIPGLHRIFEFFGADAEPSTIGCSASLLTRLSHCSLFPKSQLGCPVLLTDSFKAATALEWWKTATGMRTS